MGPLGFFALLFAVGVVALAVGFFAGQCSRTGNETFLARRLTEANRCIREIQSAINFGVGSASILSMIRHYWEAQSSDATPETYADPTGDVPVVPVHAIGDRHV